jgi:hypothetical protein
VLLIISLGLFGKLTLISGDSDFGTSEMDDFDWSEVGISVLTGILKQAAVKTLSWFYISFVFPLTDCQ